METIQIVAPVLIMIIIGMVCRKINLISFDGVDNINYLLLFFML